MPSSPRMAILGKLRRNSRSIRFWQRTSSSSLMSCWVASLIFFVERRLSRMIFPAAWEAAMADCKARGSESLRVMNWSYPLKRKSAGNSGAAESTKLALLQCRFVEFFPVVEVVEVHGIARGVGVVRNAVGADDRFARAIVVNVTADRSIQLFDGRFVELHTGLLFNPVLELRIGWFLIFDEVDHGLALQAKRIEDHLIVTLADARVTRREFAALFERDFEPEPRQ